MRKWTRQGLRISKILVIKMILDLKTSLKFLFWDQLKYDKEYPTLWKLFQEVDKMTIKKELKDDPNQDPRLSNADIRQTLNNFKGRFLNLLPWCHQRVFFNYNSKWQHWQRWWQTSPFSTTASKWVVSSWLSIE